MPPKNKPLILDFISLYPSIMPNFNASKYRKILRKAKLKKIQESQNEHLN